MNTISVPVRFLQAAAITAAKNDVRYYLNSILIDIMPGAFRIVSTDGHRISAFHVDCADMARFAPAQIIAPLSALKGIKPAKGCFDCFLSYDPDNLMGECRIAALKDSDRVFHPMDAKYPDYSRVLPREVSGKLAAEDDFNADYIADFKRMAEILGARKKGQFAHAGVYPNDKGPAAVLIPNCPEFYGAVMPMRLEKSPFEAPSWYVKPLEKAA